MTIAVTDSDIMIYCDHSGCLAQEGIMYWTDPETAIREAIYEVNDPEHLRDGWLIKNGRILCSTHRTDLQKKNSAEL